MKPRAEAPLRWARERMLDAVTRELMSAAGPLGIPGDDSHVDALASDVATGLVALARLDERTARAVVEAAVAALKEHARGSRARFVGGGFDERRMAMADACDAGAAVIESALPGWARTEGR